MMRRRSSHQHMMTPDKKTSLLLLFSMPSGLMRHQRDVLLTLLLTLGVTGGSWALSDPTQPPAVWVAAQPAAPGAAPVTTGEPSSAMQMVVISQSRKFAVIDGEIVKVGDEYKGSKVVAIRADKVVLEDAKKSLTMMPDVAKKPPARFMSKKKRVVLPAGDVSPKAMGGNQ